MNVTSSIFGYNTMYVMMKSVGIIRRKDRNNKFIISNYLFRYRISDKKFNQKSYNCQYMRANE